MKPGSEDKPVSDQALYQLLLGSEDTGGGEVGEPCTDSHLYQLLFGTENEPKSSTAAGVLKPNNFTISEKLKANLLEIKRKAQARQNTPSPLRPAPVLSEQLKARLRDIRALTEAPKLSKEWEARLNDLGLSKEIEARVREIIALALDSSE